MRLFVWDEFEPDYYDGLAFAVAESLEEAQALINNSRGRPVSEWGPVQEFDLSSKISFHVKGGI